MDSAAKRARAAAISAGGGDRLSALPDELLHAVMSFLGARQAVQTAVLSRRWWDLWRSTPAINLDSREFPAGWEKMEDFAANLLMRHNAPGLDSFRLRMDLVGPVRHRHIDRWIRRAISDNPLVLEVSVVHGRGGGYGSYESYQFPSLGSSPCRRRLKRLHLRGVSLDHSFAELLPSRCPDLEDLVLENCCVDFCGIRSDTLKNLVLGVFRREPADVFLVRAPRLASLCLDIRRDCYRRGVSLDAGDSLVRASVILASPPQFHPKSEAMLLGRLSNTTSLKLQHFEATAVLDKEFAEVPTFDNLKTLSLNWCFLSKSDVHKVKALGRFLQKCPVLENLSLKNFWVSSVLGSVEFPILGNMRTLILDGCDLADFQLLRCCLQNFPTLEKLTARRCNFRKVANGEGKAESHKAHSFQCPKLKYTEIIYEDYDNIPELVSFLRGISECGPKNAITVTKYKDVKNVSA